MLHAALMIVLITCPLVSLAQEEQTWSISPYGGLHGPFLDQLNDGLFQSPFELDANIFINGDPQNSVTQHFVSRAPLPRISMGPIVGFEFQWHASQRHSFIIGIGSWEQTVETQTLGIFPAQGFASNAVTTRKATLSFNEFDAGWRYDFLVYRKKNRWYSRFDLHQVFDIDYRDRWTWLFLEGPSVGFKRLLIFDTQTTGALLFGTRLGWERRISKWFGFGVEVGYLFGIGDVSLRDLVVRDTFRDGDALQRGSFGAPARANNRGSLEYLSQDGTRYLPLRISFGGWRATIRFTF